MRWWLVFGVIINALVLLLAIGGSYALSLHVISQRQQVWCPLLTGLTAQPLPVTASREDRRTFSEIVAVKHRFC